MKFIKKLWAKIRYGAQELSETLLAIGCAISVTFLTLAAPVEYLFVGGACFGACLCTACLGLARFKIKTDGIGGDETDE